MSTLNFKEFSTLQSIIDVFEKYNVINGNKNIIDAYNVLRYMAKVDNDMRNEVINDINIFSPITNNTKENNIENAILFIEAIDEKYGESWSENSQELAEKMVEYAKSIKTL